MKRYYLFLAAAVVWFVASPSIAGDTAAGEQAFLSKACIGCHGPAGASPSPAIYPALKGKDAAYLVEQLNAFRTGTRSNPLMSPMAVGLSDEDVANIAAYLAAQK